MVWGTRLFALVVMPTAFKMDWYGKQSNQPIVIKHTKQRNYNKIVVMRWQLTRRWEILTFYLLTLYPVQVTWGHVDENLQLKQNCKHDEVRNLRRKSVTLRFTASQCFYIIIYMYVRLLENLKAAKLKISPSSWKPKNTR